MNLGFSTEINGKETLFVDTIIEGLINNELISQNDYNHFVNLYIDKGHTFSWLKEQKIHTIREDKNNRWKIGNKIHFIINNRTKNRFQFAPVLYVKNIQPIKIYNVFNDRSAVEIDGKLLTNKQIDQLAANDGFFSTDDFWDFFSGSDFEGKIIHWTNYLY